MTTHPDSVQQDAQDVPVSEALIRAAADSNDWTSVISLDLNGRRITRMDGVERCQSLRVLDLSFNSLAHVQGCETLLQLKDLKLHDNQLKDLQSVRRLSSLQVRPAAAAHQSLVVIRHLCCTMRSWSRQSTSRWSFDRAPPDIPTPSHVLRHVIHEVGGHSSARGFHAAA
jgi:hypothetical protein